MFQQTSAQFMFEWNPDTTIFILLGTWHQYYWIIYYFHQFPLLFSVFTSKTLFGSEIDSKLIKKLEIFSIFHGLLEVISLYWLCRVVRDDYAQLFQLCNMIHVGSLKATVRVFTPKKLGNATYRRFPPRDREPVLKCLPVYNWW